MRQSIRTVKTHCKLYMGVFDATATGDAAYQWPPGAAYSDASKVTDPSYAFPKSGQASFEGNYFRLDGAQLLAGAPDSAAGNYSQGLISAALSDASGAFSTPPEISIAFSVPHTMVGLSLTFGACNEDAPGQITFLWYKDDTMIQSKTVTEVTAYFPCRLDITEADKIVLRFDRTQAPHGRVHLRRIEYGIGYTFQDANILKLTEKHKDAPVATALPTSSLSFALDNSGHEFDAGSAGSLVAFFAQGQKVTASYGVDLPNGTEWVPGGVWELSDWSSSGDEAQFKAVDTIEQLTGTTYEKGVYDWNNHSLYSLAEGVITDAGVTDYYIDPVLKNTSIGAPLALDTHAAVLQTIANRACARLFMSKDGKLSIERLTMTPKFSLLPKSESSLYTDYSDTSSVLDGTGRAPVTFERDYFRLDGSQKLLPDDLTQVITGSGMTSKAVSGEGGSFSANPLIWYVAADSPMNVDSITVDFGEQIPAEVWLYWYIDGAWTCVRRYPTQNLERFEIAKHHVTGVEVAAVRARQAGVRMHFNSVAISNLSDFALDNSETFDTPSTALLTKLRNVTAAWTYRSYYGSLTEELAKTQADTNSGWMRIEHKCGYVPSMAVVLSDSAGVMVEATHYAFVSYVRLTSDTAKTVTLTITSNKMYEVEYPISVAANATGEDLPLKSPLYDSTNIASTLDWTRDYYQQRVSYELEAKGYPEYECGDFVRVEGGAPAQIIGTELTYNGAFREKFSLRKKE